MHLSACCFELQDSAICTRGPPSKVLEKNEILNFFLIMKCDLKFPSFLDLCISFETGKKIQNIFLSCDKKIKTE